MRDLAVTRVLSAKTIVLPLYKITRDVRLDFSVRGWSEWLSCPATVKLLRGLERALIKAEILFGFEETRVL